jgi:hypothetical protein
VHEQEDAGQLLRQEPGLAVEAEVNQQGGFSTVSFWVGCLLLPAWCSQGLEKEDEKEETETLDKKTGSNSDKTQAATSQECTRCSQHRNSLTRLERVQTIYTYEAIPVVEGFDPDMERERVSWIACIRASEKRFMLRKRLPSKCTSLPAFRYSPFLIYDFQRKQEGIYSHRSRNDVNHQISLQVVFFYLVGLQKLYKVYIYTFLSD